MPLSILDPAAYSYTIYAIPTLVTMAAILLLGFFALLRDRVTAISISFFLITLSVSTWLFGISMMLLSRTEELAFTWARLDFLGIPFIAATTYQFTVIVLRIHRRQLPLILIGWVVAFAISQIAVHGRLIVDHVARFDWGWYAAYGPWGLPFIAFLVAMLLGSMWHYAQSLQTTPPGRHRERIKALMLAFGIGYAGIVDFLPAYGLDIYPIGYVAILGFVALAFRAIWIYNLDDITPALAAREIIDTMSDGLLVLDPDGVLRVANQAATSLFNTTQEALLGRPMRETSIARILTEDALLQVLSGEAARYQVEFVTGAGETRYLGVSASMKGDKRGLPIAVVLVVRDVTARRRAEAEIQTLNESLERRVEERTSQLQTANRELEAEIVERKRAEEERARLLELEQQARRRAEQESERATRLAEAVDRALAEAHLINAIATAAAGQEDVGVILNGTLDNLSQVISFSGGSIALVEGDKLVVRAAFGPFADLALGTGQPRGPGKAWQIVERVEPFLSRDLQVDGVRATSPVRSFLGVPLVWAGVGFGLLEVDSTSPNAFDDDDLALMQKVAAALSGSIQLARLYRQTEDAVHAREVLLSVVSHDLRNLLTAVSSSASLLRRFLRGAEIAERERVDLGIKRIDVAVSRMNGLIGELLDFAQMQAGEPLELHRRRADLVAVVLRLADEHQHNTDTHRLVVQSDLAELQGLWDTSRIERVIDNLLSNAIKYSPRGGDITIELRREDEPEPGWAVLTVRDQGLGIPEADLPHIFGWFRRAGNVAGRIRGTGIGLASVAQVVEQHGGTIGVTSQEGAGSAFTVRLPLRLPAKNGAGPHANGAHTPPQPAPGTPEVVATASE